MGSLEEVKVEAVCTPDFQWKNATDYAVWPGLKSISHPFAPFRKARFLHRQFVNPVRCIKHAVDIGAHLIHFSNINHLSFPYWLRPLEASGLRVAVSVHDIKRQKSILNRRWEERQLKAFYRYADALFVHSTYQLEELVDYAGVAKGKIHVVPHGPYPHGEIEIDPTQIRNRLDLPLDTNVALFFGQIRDEKNLGQLMEALAKSDSHTHLVVAGRAGGKNQGVDVYRQLAQQLGIADRVTFINRFITDEEVPELFAASDWIALPYSNSFTSQSGVLNVAVHYRRPVLVSSSPVLRETVQTCDIGVVCDGDTAEKIVIGIDRISERLKSGHEHEFDRYHRMFSWEENARRTLNVYKDVLT